jgi:hypothetical protein
VRSTIPLIRDGFPRAIIGGVRPRRRDEKRGLKIRRSVARAVV